MVLFVKPTEGSKGSGLHLQSTQSTGASHVVFTDESGVVGRSRNGLELWTQASVSNPEDMSGVSSLVHQAAMSRSSVTIINHATPPLEATPTYNRVVEAIVDAVAQPAERALQIVADEIAKEKQMLRLMVGVESEQAPTVPKLNIPLVTDEPSPALTSRSTKSLSGPLQKALTSASRARDEALQGRFGIYSSSADHLLECPQHERSLTSLGFSVHPPPVVAAPHSEGEGGSRKESMIARRISLRRKSSMHLIEQLAETDPVSPIPNNGWCDEPMGFEMNGLSSYISLPPISALESLIKSFTVDFWLMTDCKAGDGRRTILHIGDTARSDVGMQLHVGLNWYPDLDEGVRVYIRDAANRVCEFIVPFDSPAITDGSVLHNIRIRVINLEECTAEAFIDGEPVDRLRFLQSEHPSTFNRWSSNIFIGGSLDDNGNVLSAFRGLICELRFWGPKANDLITRWPLLTRFNTAGKLIEETKNYPVDHHEVLHDLHEVPLEIPEICPVFDGNVIVNMGTMSSFGDFLNHWGVDITFRTTCSQRCMSLIGFTDTQFKMMESGIVLNAEPTMGRDRYRYHEHHITFFVVDSSGRCLSCLVRGSERNNVMDGQWHTLSVRIVDAEVGTVDVLVDGLSREVIGVVKDAPRSFLPLREWVCVGGHNNRGWRTTNIFEGNIRHCAFLVRGERFSDLHLNHGPGCGIIQDMSGRHNHGLLQDPVNKTMKKHTADWVTVTENSRLEETIVGSTLKETTITMFKSNRVWIAAVRFTGSVHRGHVDEHIWDLIGNSPIDIDENLAFASQEREVFGGWLTLPDRSYHAVESIPAMRETIANRILGNRDLVGHTLLVIKIGDCRISVLNLTGPHFIGKASFDPILLRWVPHAVASSGADSKKMTIVNDMANSVWRCLHEVSLAPNIVMKLGPHNQLSHNVTASSLMQHLRDGGARWKLALVMHELLLNAEAKSSLHFVVTCPPMCSAHEASSVVLLQESLRVSAQDRGAILIQRAWRAKLARIRVANLVHQRNMRRQRVEEIVALRRTNPLVLPKRNLKALVITMHEYGAPFLKHVDPSIADDVLIAIAKQGYIVEHVRNPSKSQLMKAIQKLEPESCNFVYIHGYGGYLNIREAPHFSVDRLSICISEEASRESIAAESATEMHKLFNAWRDAYWAEMERISAAPPKKKKGSAPQRKRPMSKQQLAALQQQQRHFAEVFHGLREELDQAEMEERTAALYVQEEAGRMLLVTELQRVVRQTSEFARRSNKRKAPVILPTDARRIDVVSNDVIPIEEVVNRALMKPMSPIGYQCVVAVDLIAPTVHHTGAFYLSSTAGHTLCGEYPASSSQLFSWELGKALNGHCARLPIRNKELFLQGACETQGGARDWRSFAHYIGSKLVKSIGLPPSVVVSALECDMPYAADLVPLRTVPFDEEAREKRRRDREMRRASCTASVAVDASRVLPDMQFEMRALLKVVGVTEVVGAPVVLIQFSNGGRGQDSLILDDIEAEARRVAGGDVDVTASYCREGVLLEISSAKNDRPKMIQAAFTLGDKAGSWSMRLRPYAATPETRVAGTFLVFYVRSSSTQRKARIQQKELLKPNAIPSHLRLLSFTVD